MTLSVQVYCKIGGAMSVGHLTGVSVSPSHIVIREDGSQAVITITLHTPIPCDTLSPCSITLGLVTRNSCE